MSLPYIGRIRIACGSAVCEKDTAKGNVTADCLGCERSDFAVLNLDGIAVWTSPAKPVAEAQDAPVDNVPEKRKKAKEKATDGRPDE